MAISTKIEPLDRDIALILSEDLSPEARSAVLAEYAHEQISEVRMQNAQVLGQVPDYEVIVDGRRGASLESVKPSGVVVAEFDLLLELFAWIGQQLVANSPVRSGLYSRSHVFLADGIEVEPTGAVPEAAEYVFANTQPYARKIENGLSAQAPDGVYQSVAAVATRRFGNVARIYFGYREFAGGAVGAYGGRFSAKSRAAVKTATRQPAIIIKLGR